MTTTVSRPVAAGVRFRDAGRISYFDAAAIGALELGEYVIAETERGLEMGHIVIAPGQMLGESPSDLKPLLRRATGEDREAHAERKTEAEAAVKFVRRKAEELRVPLSIVTADFDLEGTTIRLYYEADEHVDYRSLVRAVADESGVAVQVERVGPRDRARLVDGYDLCGLRLCCASWLSSFPAVSIKMAKEQNLSLNPSKISGVCGRLYCCLTYEYEAYRELRGTLPKLNARVDTPSGHAKVIAVNPLRQSVTLLMDSDRSRIEVTKEQLEYGKTVRPLDIVLGEPTPEGGEPPAPIRAVIGMEERRPPARPQPPQQQRPPQQRPPDGGGRPRRRRDGTPGQPEQGQAPQMPFGRRRPEPPSAGESTPQQPPAPQSSGEAGDQARKRRRRRRRRGGGGEPGGSGEPAGEG